MLGHLSDSDDDAMHLARAARVVVHKELFDQEFTFSGSFRDHDSVPHSLLALVSIILEGPNINHQHRANTKAAISISQLLLYSIVSTMQEMQKHLLCLVHLSRKHHFHSIWL